MKTPLSRKFCRKGIKTASHPKPQHIWYPFPPITLSLYILETFFASNLFDFHFNNEYKEIYYLFKIEFILYLIPV